MLSAVVIVLREVLEASLLASILLSNSKRHKIARKWIWYALGIGLMGSILYANYLSTISSWLNGVGQEILNACLLSLVVIFLSGACIWIARLSSLPTAKERYSYLLEVFSLSAMGILIIREGAEIFAYLYGVSLSPSPFLPVIIGGSLGIGIGLSSAALIYYCLISIPKDLHLRISLTTLAMIAAGISAHIALYLVQSDWLSSQAPLWDTSQFLSDSSVLGQLLYAFLGYEATPTTIQVIFYVTTLTAISLLIVMSKRSWPSLNRRVQNEKTALS